MNFHDTIRYAIEFDDINDAVRTVQDAIGVDDGGYASMHFSHLSEGDWIPMSKYERAIMLMDYAKGEFLLAEDM